MERERMRVCETNTQLQDTQEQEVEEESEGPWEGGIRPAAQDTCHPREPEVGRRVKDHGR